MACRQEPAPPRWIKLAAGFRPKPLDATLRTFGEALAPESRPAVRLHDDGETVWVERLLPRSAWTRDDTADSWWTARPGDGGFEQVPDGHTRLLAEAQEIPRFDGAGPPPPGMFAARAERLELRLAPGAEPPESALFGVRASSGAAFDGVWHVRRTECSGTGIPAWSGQPEELVLDLPPACALRLTTSRFAPALGDPPGNVPRLRVLLDGSVLLDVEQRAAWTPHVLALPFAGRKGARLSFEYNGRGTGLFLAPVIGPAEVGRSGARPWGATRPDIVLFLADTFRADNLGPWGGPGDLAPELDRAASLGRRFLEARSAASWTLPSISTLLTGLYPPQHGATDKVLSLSRGLTTVVEELERVGYRTGAITDGAFFSQAYGLDQGFDWFVELPQSQWDLDRTVDEALGFLAQDDGRPVFLVVHTYRAHYPYRQGPDEDASGWDALYAEGREQFRAEPRRRGLANRIYLAFVDRFRALYLDGVRDLDRGFGRFFRELERRGTLAHGYFVFSSDHGEAFGEHGEVQHGGELYDSKLRVPLFLLGPDIAPGEDRQLVSLVDLAPTFAALAGLTPDPRWEGRALGAPGAGAAQRVIYAFEDVRPLTSLTILEGGRKVFATPDVHGLAAGSYVRAFDLAQDRGEEHPLEAASEWPAELCRARAGEVGRLLRPLGELSSTTGEQDAAVKALGYAGEEPADGEKEPDGGQE